MPGNESKLPNATSKLLDEEVVAEAKRREKISKVTLEFEEILIREDLTMGDLGEIMDLFNSRAHSVFSKTKIKTLKETYGKI